MHLEELSKEYDQSARQVYARMVELRRQEALATSSEQRHKLRCRILALQPLYRDSRELSTITANYYHRRRHHHETTSKP